jgi:hypothetical protein
MTMVTIDNVNTPGPEGTSGRKERIISNDVCDDDDDDDIDSSNTQGQEGSGRKKGIIDGSIETMWQ